MLSPLVKVVHEPDTILWYPNVWNFVMKGCQALVNVTYKRPNTYIKKVYLAKDGVKKS